MADTGEINIRTREAVWGQGQLPTVKVQTCAGQRAHAGRPSGSETTATEHKAQGSRQTPRKQSTAHLGGEGSEEPDAADLPPVL